MCTGIIRYFIQLQTNQDQQLLYINCSANGSMFEKLAEAVSLGTASPINAEDVYRSLGNVTRLKINNVGLKEQLGKQRNFTMYTGEDVEPALSPVQLANKIKSNIFGVGFENGDKVVRETVKVTPNRAFQIFCFNLVQFREVIVEHDSHTSDFVDFALNDL